MFIFHTYLWLEYGGIHSVKVLRNMHVKLTYVILGKFSMNHKHFLCHLQFLDFRFLRIIPGFETITNGRDNGCHMHLGFDDMWEVTVVREKCCRSEILANAMLAIMFLCSLQSSCNQINYNLLHVFQIDAHVDVEWGVLLLSWLGPCTLSIL
jgi:hypothetical protein